MRQIEITFKDGSKIIYNSTEDEIHKIILHIEENYPNHCGYKIGNIEEKIK